MIPESALPEVPAGPAGSVSEPRRQDSSGGEGGALGTGGEAVGVQVTPRLGAGRLLPTFHYEVPSAEVRLL